MAPWNATGRCTVLERPRSVQVRHEDVWLDGYLTAQRRDPDGWWGLVAYRTGPGMQYRHWRPADQLRARQPGVDRRLHPADKR